MGLTSRHIRSVGQATTLGLAVALLGSILAADEPSAIQSEIAGRFARQELEAEALSASLKPAAVPSVRTVSFVPEEAAPPLPPPELDPATRARLEELERRVEAQEKSDDEPRHERNPLLPTFKPGGQIIIDTLYYTQSTTNRLAVGNAQDAVDFRRARLYAQGDAFDVFNYSVGFDFAQDAGDDGPPVFLDNYIGIHDLPLVNNLRVGHFFEPFTLDRTTSNRNVSFMERALTDSFAPARSTGVMIFDQSEDQSVYWAVGTFRAGTNVNGDDADDQVGQAVTARGVYRPYYDEPSGGRHYLHLGLGYSFRDATAGTVQFRSRPEAFSQGSEDNSEKTPYFVSTGELPAHNNQLFGTEFAWCNGPWFVQSEFVMAHVDQIGGGNPVFHGSYGLVSYMLTGEHRPYNRATATMDRVIPFENVFRLRNGGAGPVVNGRGAWELVARLSHLDYNDQSVRGGVLTDLTLGINWYLTPYNRMKFNYILSQLDGVPSGTSYACIYGLRCDMDF